MTAMGGAQRWALRMTGFAHAGAAMGGAAFGELLESSRLRKRSRVNLAAAALNANMARAAMAGLLPPDPRTGATSGPERPGAKPMLQCPTPPRRRLPVRSTGVGAIKRAIAWESLPRTVEP
jgi:hypothetical protein